MVKQKVMGSSPTLEYMFTLFLNPVPPAETKSFIRAPTPVLEFDVAFVI